MTNQTNEKITLWGIGVSPYVRKVQVALEEKKLAYEHEQILPKAILLATKQAVPCAFQKVSPLGKIPAIQIGSHCVADSAVICQFLDKKYPANTKLYPENPESYARALWFENYADNIFSEIVHKKIFVEAVVKPKIFGTIPPTEVIEQVITQELPAYLDYLAQEVSQHEWLAGDEFSTADIAITTHFISLERSGFTLDKHRWGNLHTYTEKVLARDSFKKVLAA